MTEKQIFRLISRSIGLALLGFGLADELGSLFTELGFQSAKFYSSSDRAAAGAAYLISGVLMVFMSSVITNLLYGKDE